MKRIALLLVAFAMVASAAAAWAQTSTRSEVKPAPESAPKSAKEIRGISPYVYTGNEPPPKLIVDEPLPEGLAQGIVWFQWRVENL
jgi:hypothetical protein